MAFDAGMVSFVTKEISEKIKDGKVEKIYEPGKDEIIIAVRCGGENRKLLINVGSSNARINMTSMKPENPANPPMFCMMLRKHFGGAKVVSVEQLGFERAIRITFDAYDELGYISHKHMIVEIMGTYSNLILTDQNDRIIGASKIIDFSTNAKRQILPGMTYQMPPAQDKIDPLTVSENEFLDAAAEADPDMQVSKFIISRFLGMAPVTAREIAYMSCKDPAGTMKDCEGTLAESFFTVVDMIKNSEGVPTIVFYKDGKPIEYSFLNLCQYGADASKNLSSFGELIDTFFFARAAGERVKLRASDVQRILTNAEKRISKKLSILVSELEACSEGEKYKLYADLLTANIYRMKKGDESCTVENYYDDMKPVRISLDPRFTPAQNAQKYYKKYNKAKSAKEHLKEQIALANSEYEYIYSVFDALSRAEGEKEISEIRSELYHSGYASKIRGYSERKRPTPTFTKYKTSGGYILYCGKNNLANDYITFKLSDRSDWWFHVKNMPGSHVLMKCPHGEEPSEIDFTEAATVAALNSKASGGAAVDVDYTQVKYVKKPQGSKPGYVIYHTNYSARVVPDEALVKEMKVK